MEQILKNIKDISNIKFISSTFNNVSLDLDSGNIYNIDKFRFSNSSIKYLKIDFGRYLILKNMKFYTIENNFLSYRLHYKLRGIPIYKLYHGEDFSKSDSIDDTDIDISSIIIEFENKEIIPNIFEYISHKTDEIFNVTYNSVNIKWGWTEDTHTAKRYSTSMPPGVYNIKQFNNELKKLILDVKYGPYNIFKQDEEHESREPIEIYGNKVNYPNLTLNLKNTSNNSIIIYNDSALFTFLTITTDDITLSVNNTYEINFEYLPYTNDVTISYSINTIDDNYVTLKKINPFYDIKPITDESGVEISYNDYNDRKIEIQDTNLIDLNDNTAFKLSLTPDETLGLYTVLGELSSNILTGKYGTHNSLTITDVSSDTLNINNISGEKLDISYIDATNLTLTGVDKTSNNKLKSQTVIVSSISCETLDISNGAINIFNNNNYNLNYKNYKFIIFCFKNTNKKPIEFNNFRFSDINSNNPVFSTYLLDKSSKYFRLGEISGNDDSYDKVENAVNISDLSDISLSIKIPFIEDLSAIIFEFLDPPARGLSFYYNPVDYSNKIFQIDGSNNSIYYTKNDPSFTDISAIIRYTIPSASYTLHELTELLEKQPDTGDDPTVISPDFSGVLQTYFINANVSSLNIDISNSYKIVDISNNNTYPTDISKISYMSLSGDIKDSDISLSSAEINILGELLDLSYSIIQSYERYYKFENKKPKYLLFINDNLDNSYSIHYGKDLSSSFFEYFFEKDISFINTSENIDFAVNHYSNDGDKIDTTIPRFSAILTLKDDYNHNLKYDLFSVTNVSKNGLNISGDFDFVRDPWDTIYINDVLKNHYVLIDGSGEIDNSHDTIHYSVSFDEAFLKIDSSNLIYNKLDKIGPTDNSFSIESKKKYIYMYQDLSIVELSCNDISYKTKKINTNDYYLNNVDISDVSNVVSIKTLVLDTHSHSISFQNTGSNLKLAYFSSDLSHSGTRMDIYSHPDASGWCIEMIQDKNLHLSGYGKLEFTKQEFTKNITPSMQKTILNINSGIVLTNENPTNLSDDRFIDVSNSLSNLYTGVIDDPTMFHRTDTFNPDISYSYAIMDVILKLFPIKYTKLNSGDHSKFGSVLDNGYDLYDVSNIIPQLKYILKDDNIKGITYSSLTPYLCKAIQELSAAILQLEQ